MDLISSSHMDEQRGIMEKRMDLVEKKLEEIKDFVRKMAIQKRSLQVGDFNGKLEPTEFLEWLASVENYFAQSNLTEDEKVGFTISKFKGCALFWWNSFKEGVHTWEDMKTRLKKRYDRTMFMKLLSIMQYEQTVEEYTQKFWDFRSHNKIEEEESNQVRLYRRGLRHAIQKELLAFPRANTMAEVYQLALKVEETLKSRSH